MASINSMTMKYKDGVLVCVHHDTPINKKTNKDGSNGFYCLKCHKESILKLDLANGYPLAIS